MIKKYGRYDYKDFDACIKIVDYVGLRAKVNFPHRDSAIIQVVLIRKRIISQEDSTVLDNKIWFYSVYEKRSVFS
ncbi:MAG: hypothetical protein P4L79_16130 [Legionella sp.]|uniref:hypothetical protein n=1 Tax=Legionella sp. TaxID=459 RepID=UPI002844D24D|nr:hypothetical protein [Legionella sp.]